MMHRRIVMAPGGAVVLVCTLALAGVPPEETAPPGPPPRRSAVAEETRARPPARAAESKSTGWLYLDAEAGAEYVGLESLRVKRDVVPGTVRHEDTGPLFGVGAGVKLLFLTLGPRFRFGHFRDWDLWTLDLDLGFRAPLGAIEPYLRLGGGYARLGRSLDGSPAPSAGVTVEGYNARLGFGLDYYVIRGVSLGASLSGELLGMHRPGVNLNSQDGLLNDAYKFDGASAGIGVTGGVGLGFHL
jgi:hypothetical protein